MAGGRWPGGVRVGELRGRITRDPDQESRIIQTRNSARQTPNGEESQNQPGEKESDESTSKCLRRSLCVAPPRHRFLYSIYSVIFAALLSTTTRPLTVTPHLPVWRHPFSVLRVLRDFRCSPLHHRTAPGSGTVASYLPVWRHPFSVLRILRDFRCSPLHQPHGPWQ